MNRGIILVLAGVIAIGLLALYLLQHGPSLFLKPPSEERIAFISDRGGYADIWTMRADGSDKRQVTSDAADDQVPAWSPDAREVVSISDRRNQTYQVFISAWDGRYTRCVTISEGTKDVPVWSNIGDEITFISGGKVYSAKRHGGREEQYLPPPGIPEMAMPERITYVYAAWSPSHDYLLYMRETDRGREAYAVRQEVVQSWEVEGTKTIGITAARSLNVSWAPSGLRVAAAFIDRNGENGVLVADVDAVEARDLLVFKGDGMGVGKVAWSPDGKRIAFEMWAVRDGTPNTCEGIYVISASGGEPRAVLPGDAREPSWSPDGKQIVCTVIGEDGERDIWRVNADGTGTVNLTEGEGDNYNPAWSPSPRRKT